MYLQKGISRKTWKHIRIRIHQSEARTRGSGSVPKCHRSATLLLDLAITLHFYFTTIQEHYLIEEVFVNFLPPEEPDVRIVRNSALSQSRSILKQHKKSAR